MSHVLTRWDSASRCAWRAEACASLPRTGAELRPQHHASPGCACQVQAGGSAAWGKWARPPSQAWSSPLPPPRALLPPPPPPPGACSTSIRLGSPRIACATLRRGARDGLRDRPSSSQRARAGAAARAAAGLPDRPAGPRAARAVRANLRVSTAIRHTCCEQKEKGRAAGDQTPHGLRLMGCRSGNRTKVWRARWRDTSELITVKAIDVGGEGGGQPNPRPTRGGAQPSSPKQNARLCLMPACDSCPPLPQGKSLSWT